MKTTPEQRAELRVIGWRTRVPDLCDDIDELITERDALRKALAEICATETPCTHRDGRGCIDIARATLIPLDWRTHES